MSERRIHRDGEEGYLLLGLVVACFILLLILGIAAPRVAKELERDRELESEHRAQQYVRALQLYYAKTHGFPTSIDQLVGSSMGGVATSALNVRYLRQQYKDPLTNDDFRLIHLGEAKTQVKGFFGEPLEGAPMGGQIPGSSTPGSPVGSSGSAFNNSGTGSNSGSAFGNSGSAFGNSGSAFGNSGGTSPTSTGGGLGSSATGTSSTTGSSTGTGTSTGSGTPGGGIGSTDATTFSGSKGPIVGVGSNAKGHGLIEWNGSENIEDWEFLYDPRVELLKAKVSIFGGSPAATGNGSMGSGFQSPGTSTGFGSSNGIGGSSIGGSSMGGSSFGGTSAGGTSTPGTTSGGTGNTPTSGTNPNQ